MNRTLLKGIAYLTVACLLWGGMAAAVQYIFAASPEFTPLGLVTYRQLGAGLVYVILGSIFMPDRLYAPFKNRRDCLDVLIGGGLIFGAHYCFFESIYYSNAGTGAIFLTTIPLFAALYYAVFQGRPIRKAEIVAFFLAVAGVALIVTDGNFGSLKFSSLAIVWGMASAVFAAAFSIQPLRVMSRVGVTPVISWAVMTGGLIAAIFCPPWTVGIHWTTQTALSYAFIVLGGTVIAFWCYLACLKYITPVVAGLLTCLEPLSAFLFSIVLLGVTLGVWQMAGIALILLNVAVLALAKPDKTT